MKYIDEDKLKAEIERRMDKHWEGLPDADSPEDDWTHNELCELGAFKELEHLEQFLDTLPEQPGEGLEEKDFVEEVRQYYSNNCTWDALKQPMLSIITRCARHFYELGKNSLK